MRVLGRLLGVVAVLIVIVGAVVLVSTRRGALRVENFAATSPAFDPIAFWTGTSHSWGVLENADGAPTMIVQTDTVGTPEPGTAGAIGLHLAQTLTFGDGRVQHRDWHMRRTGPGSYAATANDMVGEAHGRAAGKIFHWRWVLALSPGHAWKNVTMEQWMYQQDDATMVNHTSIKKLGLVVAQVTEQFRRTP